LSLIDLMIILAGKPAKESRLLLNLFDLWAVCRGRGIIW